MMPPAVSPLAWGRCRGVWMTTFKEA